MHRRHPLPKIWMMTDSRIGDLVASIGRLPKRSGIIFRHYELPRRERRAMFEIIRKLARRQQHTLILGDHPRTARTWGADGAHSRSLYKSHGLRTVAVHNAREVTMAKRVKADLIFVSPVFATRSHVGARTIGRVGLGQIAGSQRRQAVALGGMNAMRAKSLSALKLHGWAAIDAFRI
jgi:thiamine-phosphate pyrophosphorylase